MKKILLATGAFVILLAGCSGPGAAPVPNAAVAGENGTAMLSGHFAATLDGVKITGDGIDDMQLQNTAFVYPDNAGGKKVIFYLYSKKNATDDNVNYSFRFYVPDKTGVFRHPSTSDPVYLTLNTDLLTNSMARYSGDAVTVNIISLTATRITGTFSGIFKLGPDTPRAEKKQVIITEGSFDIPFSTGNIKPE